MIDLSSILYKFSDMDRSSQILLFLIILVFLMLISIIIINYIINKKNNKYNIINKNIKRYSDLICESEENIESLEIDEPKEEIIVSKPNSIEEISKLIENTLEQEPIDLTNFEEEQEKDAIISYDELVKRAGAKKIIYKSDTELESNKTNINHENKIINENRNEYSTTFRASKIVSPIYGIQKEKEVLNDENFIDLEEFKLDESKDEMIRENEFLGNLKTFRNNLD